MSGLMMSRHHVKGVLDFGLGERCVKMMAGQLRHVQLISVDH
jgi:hypothetical protein